MRNDANTPVGIGASGLAVEEHRPGLLAALVLAAATGRAFRWQGFRRRSSPPGLTAHETAALRLFVAIADATLEGGGEGETELFFAPSALRPGAHRVTLSGELSLLPLLEAASLTLALADGPSELVATGSTHVRGSPTFEVVSSTWLHLVRKMGFDLELHLERAGFAPRGGGEVHAQCGAPPARPTSLELLHRGKLEALQIVSAGASIPSHVQQRQAARARSGVQISGLPPSVQLIKLPSAGAGSAVAITGIFDALPLTFASVGTRGMSAEAVGEEAAREFRGFLKQEAVLPPPIVHPLLLALSLAAGSSVLTTSRLLPDAAQTIKLIRAFTGRNIDVEGKLGKPARIHVASRS